MTVRRMHHLTRPTFLRGSNGVAFGPDGRLYVAQFLAGRISAVDLTTGDRETVAGPDDPIQSPDDLAFDSTGAMYVTDLVPGRVWRRSPAGDYEMVSDNLRRPNGIACVRDRLFVNESGPGRPAAGTVSRRIAADRPRRLARGRQRHAAGSGRPSLLPAHAHRRGPAHLPRRR
ncbi:SMP-30/gluconolactonase/LRE family protein [Actinoplanes sp. RD1]|uniref:SMP-30/gluconolactonase/LRE family protein n=1 Tax=Actinoplanes sp. RD1 TaxID=3064538 RepID=UPI00274298B7|nr:SMP-30/gluconolactonase/LRE family protein [Actinoplanes sp. RD1]